MVKRLVLAGLAAILSGCNLMGGDDSGSTVAPEKVYIHDTTVIYTAPPKLGAPVIVSITTERLTGVDSAMHNYISVSWSEVPNSVGYKVYYSTSLDGVYSVVTSGRTGEYSNTVRYGINFFYAGTYFFKVSAVNNDGVESEMSPHKAIVYDGV